MTKQKLDENGNPEAEFKFLKCWMCKQIGGDNCNDEKKFLVTAEGEHLLCTTCGYRMPNIIMKGGTDDDDKK